MKKHGKKMDGKQGDEMKKDTDDMRPDKNKKKKTDKKWIQDAVPKKNKGLLHEKLGVSKSKKIPSSDLVIKPEDSTKLKEEKNFAKNMRKINKKKK